ncbi:MAG: cell division protein FtsQ/DivIB [Gammaproteobacteria bacterium]|nr:MAG: cell division protein FtsQ/DivIB [Gammaproteobacteria bacterium]
MAKITKRGATRKPVRKERQPVAWQQIIRHVVVLVAVVTVISASVYLQQDDTLPIVHVTVEGEFVHVDKAVLVAAVSPYARGSFVSVDVAAIRSAGEALPWVKQMQVRRVWPDSLHLIVEEQVAVARWGDKALVNIKGEIFSSPNATVPEGLAILQGPQNSQAVVTKRYQQMTTELEKNDLTIKRLSMDKRRAWSITLSNGIKVVLGRADSEQRFKRFVRVYQSGLHQFESQIAEMDMRYTNGLSVIWKQGQKPDFNGTV